MTTVKFKQVTRRLMAHRKHTDTMRDYRLIMTIMNPELRQAILNNPGHHHSIEKCK